MESERTRSGRPAGAAAMIAVALAALLVAPAAAAARAPRTCRLAHTRLLTLGGAPSPDLCVLRRAAKGRSPGLLLITPRITGAPDGLQYGAAIVTGTGRLLWYHRSRRGIHDLKAVRYRGRSLLAYYQRHRRGHSAYVLLDQHYRAVGRIAVGGRYETDMHDLQLTPAGTAYVGANHRTSVPGVGRVLDWVMREIDVASGRVLFEWHALDHVPLSASYAPRHIDGRPFDFFHANSIEPPSAGGHTIIVSSRNTSAIYGIDRRTGKVRWILGGKRDRFGLAAHPGWRFCGQHDARRLPGGDITLFDNGGSGSHDGTGCGVHAARVLRFRLDVAHRTAKLVRHIPSSPFGPDAAGLFPHCVGSARRGPGGETLIDWGSTGYVTEIGPTGRIGFGLRVAPWSYRAVTAQWVGRPGGRPALRARRARGGRVRLWVSWNGATLIRRWRVLTGSSPAALQPAGPAFSFTGLETRAGVHTAASYLAVAALDAHNRVLGTSSAVRVR